jgi:hypothetical protein
MSVVRSAFWALVLTCAVGGATIPRECTAASPLFGPPVGSQTQSSTGGFQNAILADFTSDSIPDVFLMGRPAGTAIGNGDGTFRRTVRFFLQ